MTSACIGDVRTFGFNPCVDAAAAAAAEAERGSEGGRGAVEEVYAAVEQAEATAMKVAEATAERQ